MSARKTFTIAGIDKGVVITDVTKGSDAEHKGLLKGLVITEVNQQKVETVADVTEKVNAAKEAGRPAVLFKVIDHDRAEPLRAGEAGAVARPRIELLVRVALQVEQGREVAVVDAHRRLGRDHRLGVERHAEPRLLDHRQVVGAVADRQGRGERNVVERRERHAAG